MIKTLNKWCLDNNRMDILDEYGGILGEYRTFTKPSEISSESPQYVVWNCLKCRSYKTLSVKDRLLIDKIDCLKCRRQNALNKRFEKLNSQEIDVRYLAKTMHSSIPEQYLHFYLKKAFSNIESQKKIDWLGNMSIDLYIPEYRVGIEYDGERYHASNENDELKYKRCKENQVQLLRVIETSKKERTKKVVFSDWHILYTPNHNYTNISTIILEIINFINKHKAQVFHNNPIIIKEDLYNIEALIKREFNKRTLFFKWPELTKYWDFDKNGDILPNHVFKSDKKYYFLKCPKCSKNYGFYPSKRRKAIPPCCCDEEQFIQRGKEIISTHEKTGIVKFNDSLLDRQIEDEILRITNRMYQCYKYRGSIETFNISSSIFTNKTLLIDYLKEYTNKRINLFY